MIHITSTTESDENGKAFPHSESREEKLLEQGGLKRCCSTVELKLPWEDWQRILLQLLRNLRICDVEFSMALQSENIRYHMLSYVIICYHMLSHPRSFRFLESLALFYPVFCHVPRLHLPSITHGVEFPWDFYGISHCYVWLLGFSIHPHCTAGMAWPFFFHARRHLPHEWGPWWKWMAATRASHGAMLISHHHIEP